MASPAGPAPVATGPGNLPGVAQHVSAQNTSPYHSPGISPTLPNGAGLASRPASRSSQPPRHTNSQATRPAVLGPPPQSSGMGVLTPTAQYQQPPQHQLHGLPSQSYHHPQNHAPNPTQGAFQTQGIPQNPSPTTQNRTISGYQSPPKAPTAPSGAAPQPPKPHFDSTSKHMPSRAPTYEYIVAAIANATPEVARQAIRDNWEKTVLGSQYHLAFLLNVILHQGAPDTLRNGVAEFGQSLARESTQELIQHLRAEDIDSVADTILNKASNGFLDKALARRLETIPARNLVNALARAERLGYDVQDIVSEDPGEHVIPSLRGLVEPSVSTNAENPLAATAASAPQTRVTQRSTHQSATAAPAPIDPYVYCNDCGWPCSSHQALAYHQSNQACRTQRSTDKVGKDICPHCGGRFPGGLELSRHNMEFACGNHPSSLTQKMLHVTEAHLENMSGSQGTPKVVAFVSSPRQSAPTTPKGDPYAHLTKDQRVALEKELHNLEQFFGKLMREAHELSEPDKSSRLNSLKNRFNTRQSMARKKYGVRLRERRTKAEIDAERARLLGPPGGPRQPGRENGPASKKPRLSDDGTSTVAVPAENQQQTPQRSRIAVADIGGGLTGSQATAEMRDPTESVVSSSPRPLPKQPQVLAEATAGANVGKPKQTGGSFRPGQGPLTTPQHAGTLADPMSIDESESDTDSDGDIPATRPPA